MTPEIQPTNASPVTISTITGQVIDKADGLPLARATVRVVNAKNEYLGDGVAAGSEGYFLLYSPLLAGNFLEVSHIGYTSQRWDPADMAYYTVIELQRSYDSLAEVVEPRNNRLNPWPWVIGAGFALLLLKKKKR